MRRSSALATWLPAGVVFILALAAYGATLAPSITWQHDGADSGDLATAAWVGGVPHPPGYPTYMLLAGLFARLSPAEPARGVNWLSAFSAAVAGALTAAGVARLLAGSRAAPEPQPEAPRAGLAAGVFSAVAGLLFAFSSTLWSQAVIAEVYALGAACAAGLLLLALLTWQTTGSMRLRRLVWSIGFLLGLAAGAHLTVLLLTPALIWLVASRLRSNDQRAGTWIGAGAFVLLGLAIFLTLPLRAMADPLVNWGDPRTPARLLWLVSGRLYHSYAFSFPLQLLPARLSAWLALLRAQFGLWGIGLALAGVWYLFSRQRRVALFTLLAYFALVVYALGYDTGDSYVYLISSHIPFVWWIGYGLWSLWGELAGWRPAARRAIAVALLVVLLPLAPLLTNAPAMDLRQDFAARDYAVGALSGVAPDALLLVERDAQTFALWYAAGALGLRPDVVIVSVELYEFDWYRASLSRRQPAWVAAMSVADLIEANRRLRPIYLTNTESPLAGLYTWQPAGALLRLQP